MRNEAVRPKLVVDNPKSKSLDEISAEQSNQDDGLEKWWAEKNVVIRRPAYGQSAETPENRIEMMRQMAQEGAANFLKRIQTVKKCVPNFNDNFFVVQTNQIVADLETALQDETNLLKNATDPNIYTGMVKKPRVLLAMLENKFTEEVQAKSTQHFTPLMNAARSDVKRFLIKHFNTIDLPPEEAQQIIQERHAINLPIRFGFRTNIFNIGEKKDKREGVAGQATDEMIDVFFEDVGYLENGQLNEAETLDTIVHEIVHTVSEKSETGTGLESEKIFDTENPTGKKTPETYLNEITTQIVTLGIVSKYYDRKTFLNLRKPEKQGNAGYQDMVEGFKNLMAEHPEETKTLLALATDTMLQGDFTEIKKFLAEHEDIYLKLKNIVTYKTDNTEVGQAGKQNQI